jgi:hypothetical protein
MPGKSVVTISNHLPELNDKLPNLIERHIPQLPQDGPTDYNSASDAHSTSDSVTDFPALLDRTDPSYDPASDDDSDDNATPDAERQDMPP